MSNPGPASTQTAVYLLNGNAADGSLIASSGGKVGFYGTTPVVQAGAITSLATTPTTAETVAAVNAIITALKNVGLTA
ncbi:MAG: hypothetical protein ACR2IJ_01820 [Fluviibacter sp.]|jgi:hypothetical protein